MWRNMGRHDPVRIAFYHANVLFNCAQKIRPLRKRLIDVQAKKVLDELWKKKTIVNFWIKDGTNGSIANRRYDRLKKKEKEWEKGLKSRMTAKVQGA